VLVFDHPIRRRVWGGIDRAVGTPRQPVTIVHNDYTVNSGPQRVRSQLAVSGTAVTSRLARPAGYRRSRRLIVWCKGCRHQVELDPAEMAARYGAETPVLTGASGWSARSAATGRSIWSLRASADRDSDRME
jgi:hypothetical protein